MGLGPSKEKIQKILEKSVAIFESSEKIEYNYKMDDNPTSLEEKKDELEENNNNNLSKEEMKNINSPLLDVKKINKFPYNSIGVISVRFPLSDEIYFYTCFAIYKNVVVTLSSNLIDEKKGGKAISIQTSFSKEKVFWVNIHIQRKNNEKDSPIENNLKSELVAICFENDICDEWIGVEGGKKENFSDKDINIIFSLGFKGIEEKLTKQNEIINIKRDPYLREIKVYDGNPFKEVKNTDSKEIFKKCFGSPCYYKDSKNGAYAIAIINEFFEFQFFEENDMLFLNDMVYKGKLLKSIKHKGIDKDSILKLDLSRNDFGPLDIQYLIDFELKNLKFLDLTCNNIQAEGAFYLSQGNFPNLESLNLNFNKIEDEGMNHISNASFSKLTHLYLFHTGITAEGIKYLVKSIFIDNLIVLSLSENIIGDEGIKILKEHKGMNKLNTINLNSTELTDISLRYLAEAVLPELKKLNISGNTFTDNGKEFANQLINKKIQVSYRTISDIEREKQERKKKEMDSHITKTGEPKNINYNFKLKNNLNKYLSY